MQDAPRDPTPEAGLDAAPSDLASRIRQTFRLIMHIPDYDTYIRHLKATQPGKPLPSYEEFIAMCQERRFGSGYLLPKCY